MKKIIKLSVLILLVANFGFAQTSNKSSSQQNDSELKNKDEHFAKEAVKGGMAEVEMGKMGQKKATDLRVKEFATMMVNDHSKANSELNSILMSKKIVMSDENKNKMNDHDLMNKTGMDFDKEYMKMMVEDHKNVIDLFEKESQSGDDADLKAFATKTLPTLKKHLESANEIYSNMK